jgi:hypothetical protein
VPAAYRQKAAQMIQAKGQQETDDAILAAYNADLAKQTNAKP